MEYLKGYYSSSNTQATSFVAQGFPATPNHMWPGFGKDFVCFFFLWLGVAQGFPATPATRCLGIPRDTRCPLHAKNRKTEKLKKRTYQKHTKNTLKTHWKHTENILKTHYNTKFFFFALRAKQNIFTENTPNRHWNTHLVCVLLCCFCVYCLCVWFCLCVFLLSFAFSDRTCNEKSVLAV